MCTGFGVPSRKYPYYNCYNKSCDMCDRTIAKDEIEKEFVALLKSLRPKKKFLNLFKATVLDLWDEKLVAYRTEIAKYDNQLKALEDKRKRIFEMREDGSYTKEEFAERKGEIENKIATTKISRSEAHIEELDLESVLTYAINFIEHLDRQWVDLKDEARLRFQQLLFPEGIPYFKGQGFGTARMSLILEQQKTLHEGESLVVTQNEVLSNLLKDVKVLLPEILLWNGEMSRFLAQKPEPARFAVTY